VRQKNYATCSERSSVLTYNEVHRNIDNTRRVYHVRYPTYRTGTELRINMHESKLSRYTPSTSPYIIVRKNMHA